MTMTKIPIIPGRGLVTNNSTKMRLDYLESIDIETDLIANSKLNIYDINNNIESYIGSTEIPLGIVGPLLFNDDGGKELAYCAAGTLEGALIASMNRGARVISKSNGFSAKIKWQKMTRSPMFTFELKSEATIFADFVENNFTAIKKTSEKHSNHAKLTSIESVQIDTVVHLKFVYNTGDAAGQNMTTTCTWHAMLFIVEIFKAAHNMVPVDFFIEGNGTSDKKVSQSNINSGRGIHVVATCSIPELVITEVLRTTSAKLVSAFEHSKKITLKNGMVGNNINVTNAIAAIFVATGQDLASIHESGVGILQLEKEEDGLSLQLTLPNLVIGTVGGGTSLPKQSQALEIMKCLGNNKVNRFAKLIAGFTLGLEISTFAAIVSGEFAKSHEKLGRNKPVKWLLRSELTSNFIKSCLNTTFKNESIQQISIKNNALIENGILTNIASKINKKLIGFIPFEIQHLINKKTITTDFLIKSKALDKEVMKGLHIIAASIDPNLSDLLWKSKKNLEYHKCHVKEIDLNEFLNNEKFHNKPVYYGKHINTEREIFFLIQEFLDFSDMKVSNSENHPEKWQKNDILSTIKSITEFHQNSKSLEIKSIQEFKPWKSKPLYKTFLNLLINQSSQNHLIPSLTQLRDEIDNLENEHTSIHLKKTVIHNDFNPRNITIKKDGTPIIYDWELAMIDFPHRDIIELLSFVLPENFQKEELLFYLKFHFNLYGSQLWKEWLRAYKYSLKVYIISRVSFYEVSGIVVKYDFSNRVLNTAINMLNCINEYE